MVPEFLVWLAFFIGLNSGAIIAVLSIGLKENRRRGRSGGGHEDKN